MAQQIGNVWQRIETWAKKNCPEALAELNPGASQEQIAILEKTLGTSLPLDLRESLLRHNGENDDGRLWASGGAFLSTESIATTWARLTEVYKSDVDVLESDQVQGPMKPLPFSPKRIPVIDFNSDEFWFIDLDPAEGGSVGQVIHVFPEAGTYQVVAKSFHDFLDLYSKDLESGRFEIDKEGFLAHPESNRETGLSPEMEYALVNQCQLKDLRALPDGSDVTLTGRIAMPSFGTEEYTMAVKGGSMAVRGNLGEDRLSDPFQMPIQLFEIQGRVRRVKKLFREDFFVEVVSYKILSA